MKYFKKNLWVLGTIFIILLIGGAIYLKDSSSSIKPSDVWNPSSESFGKWQDCKSIDCNLDVMKNDNGSVGAKNFVKLHPDLGYLSDFKEMGKVDLGTVTNPNMANTNDTYFLLNGRPNLVDTFIADGGELGSSIKKDPLYAEMKNKYSEIFLWGVAKDFVEKKTLSNSDEEYIFKYDFVDACRICDTEYSTKIGFTFKSDGEFTGLNFLQLDKDLLPYNLKNATYKMYDREFKLINGSYADVTDKNDPFFAYFDASAIAYNNSDPTKADKAAVIIETGQGGGTAQYINLVLMGIKDNEPKYITSDLIDDRAIIKSLSFSGDKVTVLATIHGPKDPMCCPTLEKTFVYQLTSDNKLVEAK